MSGPTVHQCLNQCVRLSVCPQDGADVPEGDVPVAPAAHEHEERGVLALPDQRPARRVRLEPRHCEDNDITTTKTNRPLKNKSRL